jgi:hypothetical protein
MMWEVIRYVTSAFTLAAFLAAVGASIYWCWIRHKERLIRTAPEKDRAKLVGDALESFHINPENLTREQQFKLALKQMEARTQRGKTWAAVTVLALLIGGCVLALAFIFGQTRTEKQTELQRDPDAIDIADLGFFEYEADSTAPRLDVKLTNRGSRAAFVKMVKVNIKRTWSLVEPYPPKAGAVVPPSHNYVIKIRPSPEAYQVRLAVSQGLKPDEQDRFTIQLEEEPWPTADTIYLADVEIVANSNDATYKSRDLIFYITQRGTTFPDSTMVEEAIESAKAKGKPLDPKKVKQAIAANKAMVLEAAAIKGARNHALERLIETANDSDLQ